MRWRVAIAAISISALLFADNAIMAPIRAACYTASSAAEQSGISSGRSPRMRQGGWPKSRRSFFEMYGSETGGKYGARSSTIIRGVIIYILIEMAVIIFLLSIVGTIATRSFMRHISVFRLGFIYFRSLYGVFLLWFAPGVLLAWSGVRIPYTVEGISAFFALCIAGWLIRFDLARSK